MNAKSGANSGRFRGEQMRRKIEQALQAEELKSERIAAAIQLGIISVLFLVYVLAPKGFDSSAGVWFEPVKLLFFLYVPVLLLRLILISCSKTVKRWLYFNLIFDVLVVTALIFSYHVQYRQPFSLSLRAPTFLYYFIFIVLRCLSYDPFKIIFIGISSALAWIGMITYAFCGSDLIRTRNFADSIQPGTFILGAEIDKVLSLLAVTGICAAAVFRKRKLLEDFARRSVYAAAMERLVGREAFQSMSANGTELQPGRGSKRLAATMMIDLRGFSKLSYELTPERIIDYLGQYHRQVATAVFKNGGSIDKYMGDGILVHFGAVTDQNDFAFRSMKAAEDIYAILTDWRDQVFEEAGIKFDFGVAIALGEVIFGAIGHEDRMEITVIGEAVNLAAKLEKHTKSVGYRILTTLKMFETAKAQGYKPELSTQTFEKENVQGIPHTLDLIALGTSVKK